VLGAGLSNEPPQPPEGCHNWNLLPSPPFRHRYIAVRHGQSEANVAGVVSSDPAVATVEHGLTALGEVRPSRYPRRAATPEDGYAISAQLQLIIHAAFTPGKCLASLSRISLHRLCAEAGGGRGRPASCDGDRPGARARCRLHLRLPPRAADR
jgi:hypothetical protein